MTIGDLARPQGIKALARTALGRAGYSIEGVRYTPRQLRDPALIRALTLDDAICRLMFELGRPLNFVQVGAYDGIMADPLRRYIDRCGWRGVMLEPQPGPCERLRALYAGNPAITVMEAAVDATPGQRTLYTVDSPEAPQWARGLASFSRAHIEGHDRFEPGISAMIREITVPGVTFAGVLAALGSAPDLLQIDAEGADGYLLSLFPFGEVKPGIVHWESKNMDVRGQEAALTILASHGYRFCRSGEQDTLATLF